MSVKLRLRRLGNVNRPFYRVVAIDSRSRRDGRNLEELGTYDPLRQPAALVLKEEPVLAWLKLGAEMSPTVNSLFRKQGILHKWKLLRAGVSAEEATQQVATLLDTRVEKAPVERPSKKALAKKVEESAAAKKAEEGAEAKPAAESTPES